MVRYGHSALHPRGMSAEQTRPCARCGRAFKLRRCDNLCAACRRKVGRRPGALVGAHRLNLKTIYRNRNREARLERHAVRAEKAEEKAAAKP